MTIKTPLRRHQQLDYEAHRDQERFALHWEMGLGKTKLLLDVMSHLYLTRKKIDAVLVVAPNSVFSNWLTVEAPKHLAAPYLPMRYRVGASDERVLRRAIYLDPSNSSFRGKLRLVTMSYDALITDLGFEFAHRLVSLYRTMIVADESSKIKNGTTQRAKKIKKIGKSCHYRWNATGTPVSRSPFDIHSQIEFLDEDYWARFGVKSIQSFRQQFGVFEPRKIWKENKDTGDRRAMMVQEVVGYKDLERLHRMIDPIASRLLKEDSGVELPPKVYKTVTFELAPEQRKAYEELRKKYLTELEGGMVVEAAMAVVRLLRLSQIASGFVTVESITQSDSTLPLFSEQGDAIPILEKSREIRDIVGVGENPRIKAFLEVLERCFHQMIVWCAFTHSVEQVMSALQAAGTTCARYDGKTKEKDREDALRRFRSGEAQVLVSNTATMGMGLTLTEAKTLIYYENSYVLENRLQSEDRAHRIGQDQSINIIDLCAEGTVNERLLETLRERYDMAAAVNGDRFREWLELSPVEE